MINDDFEEFARVWGYLAEIYGKPLPSDISARIIFNALEPFTLEQVRRAASAYIRTAKFMPRPADLSELILGNSTERAHAAFLIALKATERVRAYQNIAFEDRTTQEVIYALGGWGEFCNGLKTNRSMTENRFLKWHVAAQSIERRRAPEVLVGIDRGSKSYLKVGADDVVIHSLQ